MIWRKKEISIPRLITISLMFAIVLVSGACALAMNQLNDFLHRQTTHHLAGISVEMTSLLDQQLDSGLETAENLAAAVSLLSEQARMEEIWSYLDGVRERCGFTLVDVVDPSGVSWRGSSAGLPAGQVLPAVEKVLEGKTIVCHLHEGDGAAQGMLYCAPIYQSGELSGVLMILESYSVAAAQIKRALPEDCGMSAVVLSDGSIVAVSEKSQVFTSGRNLFSDTLTVNQMPEEIQQRLKNDLARGEQGTFQLIVHDIPLMFQYTRLKAPDCYLFAAVSEDMISSGASTMEALTIVFMIAIILYVVVFFLFVRSQNRSRRTLEVMAYTDPVTGGLSRSRFNELAAKVIAGSGAGAYTMISMDIENFKLINGQFSSEDGNKVLKYIYQTISDALKREELVTRSYADVFHILLRSTGRESILARLGEMEHRINAFNENLSFKYFLQIRYGIYQISDRSLPMVAIEDKAAFARSAALIPHKAVYHSVAFYDGNSMKRVQEERELANRMESALRNREFVVYLQPKVQLSSHRISGAEALSRWIDPQEGLIRPDKFIPLFEKNGFIVELDLYMFSETCRLIDRWLRQGLRVPPLSVNLSRQNFSRKNFLEEYRQIYAQYDFPPELIEFELTETLAFDDTNFLAQLITDIHRMGFRCSMDDFGSGYSSLGLLKNIWVDALKIDRSFFAGSQDQRGKAVIESLIDLSRRLNISTVAEGIETTEQLAFLKHIGCDAVQGYVFSRPLSAEEFERVLTQSKPMTAVSVED